VAGTSRSTDVVGVVGLAELRRRLKAIDDSLDDIITVANKKTADMVRAKAEAKAGSLGRPGAVRSAATMKVTQSPKFASLRLGNKATPGALGEEFGAYRNIVRPTRRRKQTTMLGWNQFQGWRGSGQGAGYYFWPTVRDNADEIRQVHEAELQRLLNLHFPDGLPAPT
jgi:hypothetical protein